MCKLRVYDAGRSEMVSSGGPRRGAACLAAVLALAASGCASHLSGPLPASFLGQPSDVYKLGLGDKLRVAVYGEPSLSGEFQVSGDGSITMPLVGNVPAVGLSASELEAALVRRYVAGFLKDPKIAVEVYAFRPYFVFGEVSKPGRYPSTEGATILGAIATAGGFTYRANKKRVFLRRAGDSVEREIDVTAEIRIQPGDVLRVGERYF